jgi:hypothetical protein
MSSEGHQPNGRFAPGNPGGPGRPRRAVERQYLAALSDAISLEAWQEIVKATVVAAKQGDPKARDWLTRYLIGDYPRSLTELAADELAGLDAEQDIVRAMVKRIQDSQFQEKWHSAELALARKLLERAEALKTQATK